MNLKISFTTLIWLIFATLTFNQTQLLAATITNDSTNLPIEYFSKKSKNRGVKISPDGKHLIIILNQKGKDIFGVIELSKNKIISLIGVHGSGGNIGEVNWVNNSRIVYTIYELEEYDQRPLYSGELYAVNIDGTRHSIIFGYRAGESQTNTRIRKRKSSHAEQKVLDFLKDDPQNILIAYYPWKLYGKYWRADPDVVTLIKKLNVFTGRLSNVDALPISLARAIVDNNGVVRFAIGTNKENKSVISYKKDKNSKWKEFKLDKFEGKNIYPFSFTENNRGVYLTANVGDGTRALYLFDLETNAIKKIFHDESIDISKLEFDFDGRRIVYVATEKGLPIYHYLEPKNKKAKLHKSLMKAFKGQDVVITSATKDGKKMVVYVYADNNPGDFYLFDTKTLNADFLMAKNSWIDPERLITTKSVDFTTRDNQKIQGYLTLPKNHTKDQLVPLVVYPHGGPHGVRDEWGYQWSVQLLANRGYAVLQVNFRGSGGFGSAFQTIGYGKWGTLMQDDLTDATKAIIEQNIADPERICIYGASYGGYAALMGAVREPELYTCAIGFAGVYDLPLMFEEGDIANINKSGLAYLKKAIGDDIDDMKRRSPVYNVNKIKANILLIHGQKDERVPIVQAERLREAFDEINKEYEWLELKHEGHGYNNNKTRKIFYQKILSFLDKNIGNRKD